METYSLLKSDCAGSEYKPTLIKYFVINMTDIIIAMTDIIIISIFTYLLWRYDIISVCIINGQICL